MSPRKSTTRQNDRAEYGDIVKKTGTTVAGNTSIKKRATITTGVKARCYTVLALGIAISLLPIAGMLPFSGVLPTGGASLSGSVLSSGVLLAAAEAPVRTYTFAEVGAIAQNNSNDIIRQKATIDQAESSKESQLSSYQNQVYEYYSNPDSNISESSLYSLQESYEKAYNTYLDAEETLAKLKPKVAYQAQKLYLDILQGDLQIQIQEKEVQRLQAEYELAKVKTAFGVYTQTQLRSAKSQWDNAADTLESLINTRATNRTSMREYLNLADTTDFALENPPVFGEYAKEFDEAEVQKEALKNSLALKQAQREVDDLTTKIERYQMLGEYSQAERQAANGASVDLALKETRQSLIRTVESTLKDYDGLEAALDKAKEDLYANQRSYITTQMKQKVGAATLNELRQSEKTVLSAEKDLLQAQYNCYLGAKKVILLKDGVLVN